MGRSVRIDKPFLSGVFVLSLAGLWFLYSSSSIVSHMKFSDPFYYAGKQTLWHFLGLTLMFFTMFLNISFLKKYAYGLMIASLIPVVLVFFPYTGKYVTSDAYSFDFRRWIQVGPFSLQPSEFLKITYILFLARTFEVNDFRNLKDFLRTSFFIPFLATIILLYLQPHYGTLILLFLVFFSLIYITGFPFLKIFSFFVGIAAVLILFAMLQTYRLERILVWLDPYEYRYDKGYQLVMSFRAFREGELWGTDIYRGVGHRYLVFGHTDFILPLIAEGYGFAGVLFLFLLYFWILIRGAVLLKKVTDPFLFFTGSGILLLFTFQILINVSVATGLLPTTGIGLPFVSYGGSSLISYYLMMGIFLNATAQRENT